jgi:hypothetical protein
MVTKMKMFGFFNQNQVVGGGSQGVVAANKKKQIPVSSSQFNLASIMKMQSTGCKSCRG